MALITDVALRRRDGNIITDLRPGFIGKKGWKPDKIVAASWMSGGRPVVFENGSYLGVKLVSGGNYLAIIAESPSDQNDRRLLSVNADGSVQTQISNQQLIRGKEVLGSFSWMEDTIPDQADCYCGIFEQADGQMFRIDIQAPTGKVLGIGNAR